MKMFRLLSLASFATVATSDFLSDLRAAIQPLVDHEAQKYNCAITVGFKNKNTSTSVVAGNRDLVNKVPATEADYWVWGSVTKITTGTAVMRIAEAKGIDLDSSISPLVNPFIAQMKKLDPTLNFTSIEDLWGPEASNVTVRNLARMQSGVPDFDTAKGEGKLSTDSLRADVYKRPHHEFIPAELLNVPWVHTGALEFSPGGKTHYSSTNFVLLGLILAQYHNASTWDAYDQSVFVPDSVKPLLKDIVYGVHNAPENYTKVRGYDRTSYNGHDPTAFPGTDVTGADGVLSGWTASDFIATAEAAANLVYEVYGPDHNLISQAGVDEMTNFGSRGFYGFSTFDLEFTTGQTGAYGKAYGHLGATYGFDSIVVYFPALEFSLSVGSNIERDHQEHPSDTICLVYNRVRNLLLNQPVQNCTYSSGGYFSGGCKCK